MVRRGAFHILSVGIRGQTEMVVPRGRRAPGGMDPPDVLRKSWVSSSIRRLTPEQVAQDVQDGLIVHSNVIAPSSTSCPITLDAIITYTVKATVGSYTTDDDMTWQFQDPSGHDTAVDTAAAGQDTSYPYHTTQEATAVWHSNYADAVSNFDLSNIKHETLSDFSTFLNVHFSGSSWTWAFTDGLNSAQDDSGSEGIDRCPGDAHNRCPSISRLVGSDPPVPWVV